MIRIMLLCQLLALPVCAKAGDLYHVRPLSEREMMQTYTSVMLDACRHSNGEWHELPSGFGYWGDGVSEGNEGIRAVGVSVLTFSTLLKYSDVLSDAERKDFLAKTRAAIRYMVSTHVTGTGKCADGKQWGEELAIGDVDGHVGFGGVACLG